MLARVRALLRRRQTGSEQADHRGNVYEFAGWRLDVVRRDLRDPTGIFINLSDGEFALLRTFVEHPQWVLSRDQLLDDARGRDTDVYDRAVHSQISRLRRKINERVHTELIRTVRNEGYMLLPGVSRLISKPARRGLSIFDRTFVLLAVALLMAQAVGITLPVMRTPNLRVAGAPAGGGGAAVHVHAGRHPDPEGAPILPSSPGASGRPGARPVRRNVACPLA